MYFLEHCLPPGDDRFPPVLIETKRAIATSNQIITEMLEFVQDHPAPLPVTFPIGKAIASAWQRCLPPDTIAFCAPDAEAAALQVTANFDQVVEIISHLFQNALQAMPGGGELRVNASPEEDRRVCVRVEDTGCGIPEEHLGKIFDPLFSTKLNGIGLGLAIARRYVEMNGGSLTVESKVGSGTTFRLRLPADLGAKAHEMETALA